jgi:hypothetical protein
MPPLGQQDHFNSPATESTHPEIELGNLHNGSAGTSTAALEPAAKRNNMQQTSTSSRGEEGQRLLHEHEHDSEATRHLACRSHPHSHHKRRNKVPPPLL